jgi:ubiquinone/menaquinone biosynthesis C-methylase UbiE
VDERAFSAAQSFLLSAKTFWTTTMYQALRAELGAAVGDAAGELTVADVAAALEDRPLYQYFAWLERHLQRLKYAGRYGLVPYHRERRDALLADLQGQAEVDPDFQQPGYYTGCDIHQHPGGVWSEDIAGCVYERGARTTTPLLGAAHKDLHGRFTDLVAAAGAPHRILDMGCGFGKSTGPFAAEFPDAQLEAVDLSAPCVKLAAHLAAANEADHVRFRQLDARHTDYDDASFDLVTSTMLLHELPPKALDELLEEAFRVLEPGGRMVHLDYYALPDGFRRFLHYGHARRNNEPFMQPLAERDLARVLRDKGFTDVQIKPFQEAEDVDLDANDAWRFPWTVIAATKPAA